MHSGTAIAMRIQPAAVRDQLDAQGAPITKHERSATTTTEQSPLNEGGLGQPTCTHTALWSLRDPACTEGRGGSRESHWEASIASLLIFKKQPWPQAPRGAKWPPTHSMIRPEVDGSAVH